jgi:hypothetical protein
MWEGETRGRVLVGDGVENAMGGCGGALKGVCNVRALNGE